MPHLQWFLCSFLEALIFQLLEHCLLATDVTDGNIKIKTRQKNNIKLVTTNFEGHALTLTLALSSLCVHYEG